MSVLFVACICLGATALLNWKVDAKKLRKTNRISAVVCFIAFLCYVAIIFNPHRRMIRNVDWLITCPILLLEMQSLMGLRLSFWGTLAFAASIAMVVAGMSKERLPRGRIIVGFFFLLLVSFSIYRYRSQSSQRADFFVFFFGLWFFYGCVPIFGLEEDKSFALLDIASKSLFGVTVAYMGTRGPARLQKRGYKPLITG